MLTPLFLKSAKKADIPPPKYSWNPNPHAADFAYTKDCRTNCGVCELTELKLSAPIKRRIIGEILTRLQGHDAGLVKNTFMYYAPREQGYNTKVKWLMLLGFQKIYEYQHAGYLTRKGNGWTDVYALTFSVEEREQLGIKT